jgi:lambda repressor-like predicted transcriptional regulator
VLKKKPRMSQKPESAPADPDQPLNHGRPGNRPIDAREHLGEPPARRNDPSPPKSVPPGHGNSPDLLKYYLAQSLASPANLAREAGVSRAAVSSVLHGRMRSARIEHLIAKSCGRTLQELFPAWYPEHR